MDDGQVSDAELDALFGGQPKPVPPQDGVFRTPSGRDLSRYRPTSFISDRSRVSPWLEAMFMSAMEAIQRKNYADAIRHLKRCLEDNRDFIDALLWLGRLEDEPDVRRENLKAVLSLQPANSEAMRELMILDGELDPDQPFDAFTMPEVRHADGAVAAQARNLRCPRCGSPNLSDDDASPNILTCDSCGYTLEKAANTGGMQSLTRALLLRRSQEVLWVVGARTLKCHGCGAERTLTAKQMSSECPFCGSRQVIEQDALGTLSQPDTIVPFRVPGRAALEQVKKALDGTVERLKGFFVENRVKRVAIEGVFLPFWVFDLMADITHNYEVVERKDDQRDSLFTLNTGLARRTYSEKISDGVMNLTVPAVKQPAPAMLSRLGRYDYSLGVDYRPEYVAQHSAEIYTLDFDRAAMDAQSRLSEHMRQKHRRSDSRYRTTSITSLVTQASFRLVLVPVWAVTLFERDGDVRPALVNGQTGEVVLGRSAKPD